MDGQVNDKKKIRFMTQIHGKSSRMPTTLFWPVPEGLKFQPSII